MTILRFNVDLIDSLLVHTISAMRLPRFSRQRLCFSSLVSGAFHDANHVVTLAEERDPVVEHLLLLLIKILPLRPALLRL